MIARRLALVGLVVVLSAAAGVAVREARDTRPDRTTEEAGALDAAAAPSPSASPKAPKWSTRRLDSAFEALVDQAAGERDPLLREQLYQSASYVLSRSVPAAFVSWSEKWWLVRPELRGYEVSPFDWDFSTFSLARIHRPVR